VQSERRDLALPAKVRNAVVTAAMLAPDRLNLVG
jgi:hypothetical protein